MTDLSRLPTAAEVFAEMDAEMSDEARHRWQRVALGRAVANVLVAYRTAHHLSQSALASPLGMQRPAISRLELGEHNPSIETLERLASGLDLHFIVDIAPPGRRAATLPSDVQVIEETTRADGIQVLIAGPRACGTPF